MSGRGESCYTWVNIPMEEIRPDFSRKVVHGENMTFSMIFFKKGARVDLHRHANEQMSHVLSGAVKFITREGKEYTVSQGMLMHFPPNVEHGALALEDSVIIEVFSPPREDWKMGTDHYLRK
ncbi:MAG: hypothetical protein B9J98_07510 [Candidatus Terraquivivens tikiterensis]|uniref:Cupin type-2 domain-containing protein n=1 Tax=Candidatus Terraquivivens tikiterensis TaxID=1980982 RepID=A0A2R7Y2U4_9ARCH|nr:MAG: hypothetical protein B9J98_07510 [Candidatus Terraquivivens tikiterensis]